MIYFLINFIGKNDLRLQRLTLNRKISHQDWIWNILFKSYFLDLKSLMPIFLTCRKAYPNIFKSHWWFIPCWNPDRETILEETFSLSDPCTIPVSSLSRKIYAWLPIFWWLSFFINHASAILSIETMLKVGHESACIISRWLTLRPIVGESRVCCSWS